MKFDIPEEGMNLILQILQVAPVAHNIVDPILKALVTQANDPKIQSLAYPAPTPSPEEPTGATTGPT